MFYIVVTETEDWANIVAHKDGGCNPAFLMAAITDGDIKQRTEDELATIVRVARMGGLQYKIVRQRG